MDEFLDEWRILKARGVNEEDFLDGQYDVCKDSVPVTSVLIMTFTLERTLSEPRRIQSALITWPGRCSFGQASTI
jgi:hypothetical protein